jgi:hypothetical protein
MGGSSVLQKYDYVFSENGLVAYKAGELMAKQSILDHMGEEKLQTFINFCLRLKWLWLSGRMRRKINHNLKILGSHLARATFLKRPTF